MDGFHWDVGHVFSSSCVLRREPRLVAPGAGRLLPTRGTHLPRHPVPALQRRKRAASALLSVFMTCGCQGFHLLHQLMGSSLITSTNIVQAATVVQPSACKDKAKKKKQPRHSVSNLAFMVKRQHDKIGRCILLLYWMTQQGRGHIWRIVFLKVLQGKKWSICKQQLMNL